MKKIAIFIVSVLTVMAAAVEAAAEQWALPVISVAHMRAQPAHASEMVSQVLMGMPLRVVPAEKSGWFKVETPEGYSGYVIGNSLRLMDSARMARWRRADRVVITSLNEIKAYADTAARTVVTDLVPGNIVECQSRSGRWMAVVLPDGRKGWVEARQVTPISRWASQPADAAVVLAMAEAQTGAPYLWGGMSVKGMDCSGLSKMSYYHNGIILRRDASQQAVCGKLITDTAALQPGDLLFFGNKQTGKVDHVGIFVGGDTFIESSGRVKLSKVSRQKRLLHARRVYGHESEPGITRVSDHPWYF